MKHPHPVLAVVARLGLAAGIAYALAGAVFVLLPAAPRGDWYGKRAWAAWAGVTTGGQAWSVGCEQADDLAAVTAGPAGWLLAAWLLRLATTGRLAPAGPPNGLVRAARYPALACLLWTPVVGGLGIARWADPMQSADHRLTERIRFGVREGRVYRFQAERMPGESGRSIRIGGSAGPADERTERPRRVAVVACNEGLHLFVAARPAALLFLLAGTVYCLGRAVPADDT